VRWWVSMSRNLGAAKFHFSAHSERPKVSDADGRWVLSRIVRRLILSASLILETVHFRRKEKASYPHSPGHKSSQCRTDSGYRTTSWNILSYPQRYLLPLYWNNENSDFLRIWRGVSRQSDPFTHWRTVIHEKKRNLLTGACLRNNLLVPLSSPIAQTTASSEASSPQSVICCSLFQFPLSCRLLKIQ
jgi:hypothetical protein